MNSAGKQALYSGISCSATRKLREINHVLGKEGEGRQCHSRRSGRTCVLNCSAPSAVGSTITTASSVLPGL